MSPIKIADAHCQMKPTFALSSSVQHIRWNGNQLIGLVFFPAGCVAAMLAAQHRSSEL